VDVRRALSSLGLVGGGVDSSLGLLSLSLLVDDVMVLMCRFIGGSFALIIEVY